METIQNEYQDSHLKRNKISYGSVIAGALVGLVLLILLNMLGAGIGLGTIDVQREANPVQGLGTASILWYVISGIIALFIAGWVSGRLAQTNRVFDGAMHGLLSWCVITLVSMYLVTSAIGSFIGGAGRLVGAGIAGAGNGVGKMAEAAAPALKDKADQMDLTDIRKNGAGNEVIMLLQKADGNPDNVSKDDLVNVIMKTSDVNRQQASGRADTLITKYKEASAAWKTKKDEMKEAAARTADNVAKATSTAFIALFFVLITGAISAWLGARIGTESKFNVFYHRFEKPVANVAR